MSISQIPSVAIRFLATALALCTVVACALGSLQAGIIFNDNFSGPTPNPAWQVLPGQGLYTVNNGLRYYNQGPLSSPSGWSTTSLSLGLPFMGTQWEIDTKATYSLDWFCCPGSSGAQRPQAIVSFAPVTVSDRSALAGNNYADFDRGIDAAYNDNHLNAWYGSASVTGLLNPADAAINNNIADGTYWYLFVRNGGSLTMSYSYDGVHFMTALSSPLADPSNPFNELLLSGTTYLTAGSFTDYAFVTITDTSAAPEPDSSALTLFGVLACVAGFVYRRRVQFARPN